MTGKEFIGRVANGKSDIIQAFLDILSQSGSRYCLIGGLAVNAYVEPVVSLDMDVVAAADDLDAICKAAKERGFTIERFAHSINLTSPGSDLRIQLQSDPRYQEFVERAGGRTVLGYMMNVATLADVLQGKVWAYMDAGRRKSKRQKDLADILRIVEKYPALESALPDEVKAAIDT